MKANKSAKSKFVYPDKLYARCNDNKTLDISYAPQNMEAVEYARTDYVEKAFIIKAQKWLTEIHRVCDITDENGYRIELRGLQARFEEYMKGE